MSRLSRRTSEIRAAMETHQRAASFRNAAFAAFIKAGAAHPGIGPYTPITDVCQRLFPDDPVAPMLFKTYEQRAAIDPGDSLTGWAAEVADQTSLAFLRELAPESAAARMIARGTSFPFSDGQILLPRQQAGALQGVFVNEGDPIPLLADAITGVKLDAPKKVAFILGFTRETAKKAIAQDVFNLVLQEAAARSLDSAYFNDDAATADSIAGLLYGATDLSNNGLGVDPNEDAAALAASVASGSGQVVFITGPARAAILGIREPELKPDIFASVAVNDQILIAVDPRSFVHGVGPTPDISASREAVMHMESETPAEIVSGSGPTTADPVRSLWQTDAIALRAIIDVSYVARRSNAVAFIEYPGFGQGW
jgi:hypothetical protein